MLSPLLEARIHEAAAILRRGGLVAFPTETVYGLGADATNKKAVQRIFEAKGRPSTNPLIVHVSNIEEAQRLVDIGKSFNPLLVRTRLEALSTLWPGPLSLILPKAACIPSIVSAGGETVAIRIPRHPIALRLIEVFGGPIAAPSANPSQYISPTTAEHVRAGLGAKVDLIIDGGPCTVGLESTVVSLVDDPPRLLRPGAISRDELSTILGIALTTSSTVHDDTAPLPSPGLLARHYSPITKVVLWPSSSSPSNIAGRAGAIRFTATPPPFATVECRYLSTSGNLDEVAARLFSALRELDAMGLDVIVVDTCERMGLGEAIMDRLVRASA